MKLEYIDDANPDYPEDSIIRLYEFDKFESQKFYNEILKLIETKSRIDLSDLEFIECLNCTMTLKIDSFDKGIVKSSDSEFECCLSLKSYEHMLLLIEPFNSDDKRHGFQWLYDLLCPIDFLYSVWGTW